VTSSPKVTGSIGYDMVEKVKINLPTLITLFVLAASVTATYYQGQASSKEFTNHRIEKTEREYDVKVDKLQVDVNEMKTDIAVVKQILVKQYGSPKK
jgi:hypothetical protein